MPKTEMTLRMRILKYLIERGCDNIMGIARTLQVARSSVYDKVSVAKRQGHVTEQIVHEYNALAHTAVKMRKIYPTEKGKEWLKTFN
jgi:predicted DNA-binding transcriptional regulator